MRSTKSNSNDSKSLWDWNTRQNRTKRKKQQFPVTDFIQETYHTLQQNVSGPGAGVGIGCGVGAGFGLVGGVGFGGYFKLVFGVGLGCGVGVGLGYGQGFGYGFDLDNFRSYFSKSRSDSERRFAIDI